MQFGLQREGLVTHIVAHSLIDRSDLLDGLAERDATEFDIAVARADEVKRPDPRDPRDLGAKKRRYEAMYPSRDFH